MKKCSPLDTAAWHALGLKHTMSKYLASVLRSVVRYQDEIFGQLSYKDFKRPEGESPGLYIYRAPLGAFHYALSPFRVGVYAGFGAQ